tara:strand:- start:386 stop:586 length:201 start_codon:yes stop_codon:yes gene_type:complete
LLPDFSGDLDSVWKICLWMAGQPEGKPAIAQCHLPNDARFSSSSIRQNFLADLGSETAAHFSCEQL